MLLKTAAALNTFFYESGISAYIQIIIGLYLLYAFLYAIFNFFQVKIENSGDRAISDNACDDSDNACDDSDNAGHNIASSVNTTETVSPSFNLQSDLKPLNLQSKCRDSHENPGTEKDVQKIPLGWISNADFIRRLDDFRESLNNLNVNTIKNMYMNFPVIGKRKYRKEIHCKLISDIENFAALLSDSPMSNNFVRWSMGLLADMEKIIIKQNYKKALEFLDLFYEKFNMTLQNDFFQENDNRDNNTDNNIDNTLS